MKIDVTQQLTELDGTPMVTGRQICQVCGSVIGESEPMTVRLAATRALTAQYRDEQSLPCVEKDIRFCLALRLADEPEPDLKAEEIVLIKSVVGKMYGPVVVGRMWSILDS